MMQYKKPGLKQLRTLSLIGCTAITEIHPSIARLIKLQAFHISGCTHCAQLPPELVTLISIGEIAIELKVYRELFTYLKNKYSKELGGKHKLIISNLEANCFSHAKKGEINTAVGIINLKSNHGWTDRLDNTTQGDKIKSISPIEWVKDAKD